MKNKATNIAAKHTKEIEVTYVYNYKKNLRFQLTEPHSHTFIHISIHAYLSDQANSKSETFRLDTHILNKQNCSQSYAYLWHTNAFLYVIFLNFLSYFKLFIRF